MICLALPFQLLPHLDFCLTTAEYKHRVVSLFNEWCHQTPRFFSGHIWKHFISQDTVSFRRSLGHLAPGTDVLLSRVLVMLAAAETNGSHKRISAIMIQTGKHGQCERLTRGIRRPSKILLYLFYELPLKKWRLNNKELFILKSFFWWDIFTDVCKGKDLWVTYCMSRQWINLAHVRCIEIIQDSHVWTIILSVIFISVAQHLDEERSLVFGVHNISGSVRGGGGSVHPGPCSSSGTGGWSGAGELIASLLVDAEWTRQAVCREPVSSCYIFTLSKTIAASVSITPTAPLGGRVRERRRCSGVKAVGGGYWHEAKRATSDLQLNYNHLAVESVGGRTRGFCWSPRSCFGKKSFFFVSLVCCAIKRRLPSLQRPRVWSHACVPVILHSRHVQTCSRESSNYSPEMLFLPFHSGHDQSHQG